jgi:hypothetical protein
MLDKITWNDFSPCLNKTFEINLATIKIDLELVAVEQLNTGSVDNAGRQPFSLLFHGPGDRILPQHIYLIENADLGRLELFLVPVGPTPDFRGMRYEAIFN